MRRKILEYMENSLDVQTIKGDIPKIQGLHRSFWSSPSFLLWQIVRLNEEYRKFCHGLWNNGRLRGIRNSGEFFCLEYPPNREELYHDWVNRWSYLQSQSLDKFCASLRAFSLRYYEQNRNQYETCVFMPFLHGMLPIPFHVRFPLPFLMDFSPSYLLLMKWRYCMRGRPQDWGLNLLIYEASKAGMRNKQIANLLRIECRGMVYRSYIDYSVTLDKDPILVKIDRVKKRMNEIVNSIFDVLVQKSVALAQPNSL